MHELVQLLVNGVLLGMMYALLALGFVLIVKGSGVINFSHGELIMLGAYASAFILGDLGVPIWIGLPAAALSCALIGIGIERGALRRLVNESMLSLIMATIALGAIIRGLLSMFWGDGTRPLPRVVETTRYDVFGLSISAVAVWASVGTVVLLIALGWFFSRTKVGLAMQAVADDRVAAQSLGININFVNAVAWALAGAVASLAGYAWGMLIGVDGRLVVLGVLIFPVVILGGLESMLGAVVGGIVVGVVENLSAGYLDSIVGGGFSTVAPLVLLIFVLFIRPFGLFGRPEIERV